MKKENKINRKKIKINSIDQIQITYQNARFGDFIR